MPSDAREPISDLIKIFSSLNKMREEPKGVNAFRTVIKDGEDDIDPSLSSSETTRLKNIATILGKVWQIGEFAPKPEAQKLSDLTPADRKPSTVDELRDRIIKKQPKELPKESKPSSITRSLDLLGLSEIKQFADKVKGVLGTATKIITGVRSVLPKTLGRVKSIKDKIKAITKKPKSSILKGKVGTTIAPVIEKVAGALSRGKVGTTIAPVIEKVASALSKGKTKTILEPIINDKADIVSPTITSSETTRLRGIAAILGKIWQLGEFAPKPEAERLRDLTPDKKKSSPLGNLGDKVKDKQPTKIPTEGKSGVLDNLLDLLGLGGLKNILSSLTRGLTALGGVVISLLNKAKALAKPIIEKAKALAKPIVDKAKALAKPIIDKAKALKQDAVTKAKTLKQGAVTKAKALAKPIIDKAKALKQDAVTKAKTLKQDAATKTKDTTKAIGEKARALKQGAVTKAKALAKPIIEKAKALKQDAATKTKDTTKAIGEKARALKQGAVTKAKDTTKAIGEKAKDTTKSIIETAKALKQGAVTATKDTTKAISEKAKALKQGAVTATKDVVEKTKAATIKTAQDTVKVAKNIKNLTLSQAKTIGKNYIKDAFKGGPRALGKKLLSKIPIIGSLIETGFAAKDISDYKKEYKAGKITADELNQKAGTRVVKAITSIAGTAIGAAALSFIPGLGTFIGAVGGNLLGNYLGDVIVENVLSPDITKKLGAWATMTKESETPDASNMKSNVEPKLQVGELQDYIIQNGSIIPFSDKDKLLSMKKDGAFDNFFKSNTDNTVKLDTMAYNKFAKSALVEQIKRQDKMIDLLVAMTRKSFGNTIIQQPQTQPSYNHISENFRNEFNSQTLATNY